MIINVVKRIIHKLPRKGDIVWWAPKQVGCTVVKTFADGRTVFQGGPLVKRPSGRQVVRWTVSAAPSAFKWRADLGAWIVGEGPTPTIKSQIVITPPPLKIDVSVSGS